MPLGLIADRRSFSSVIIKRSLAQALVLRRGTLKGKVPYDSADRACVYLRHKATFAYTFEPYGYGKTRSKNVSFSIDDIVKITCLEARTNRGK